MKKFFEFVKSLFIDLTDYICVFVFILTVMLTLLIILSLSPIILVVYVIYCIISKITGCKNNDIIIHTNIENEKSEDVQNSTSGEEE